MKKQESKYVPALSHDWLTFIYDPVARLTSMSATSKAAGWVLRRSKNAMAAG